MAEYNKPAKKPRLAASTSKQRAEEAEDVGMSVQPELEHHPDQSLQLIKNTVMKTKNNPRNHSNNKDVAVSESTFANGVTKVNSDQTVANVLLNLLNLVTNDLDLDLESVDLANLKIT